MVLSEAFPPFACEAIAVVEVFWGGVHLVQEDARRLLRIF